MSFAEEVFDKMVAERGPQVVRSALSCDETGCRIGVVLFDKSDNTSASTPGLLDPDQNHPRLISREVPRVIPPVTEFLNRP